MSDDEIDAELRRLRRIEAEAKKVWVQLARMHDAGELPDNLRDATISLTAVLLMK